MKPDKPLWILDIIQDLEKQLVSLSSNVTISPHWIVDEEDPSPWVEIFINHSELKATHCRFHLGEDKQEGRWGFYSLGIQGCGGPQFDFIPGKDSIRNVAIYMHQFFHMIDAFKHNNRNIEL